LTDSDAERLRRSGCRVHGPPQEEKRRTEGQGRPEPTMRDKITLACSQCEERNYNKTKNKRLHPERVEYKKYCPRCRTHTMHKESK
jgi:large subunit ribosomal protein L33